MSHSSMRNAGHTTGRSRSKGPVRWTQPLLRQAVETLYRQAMDRSGTRPSGQSLSERRSVVDAIVKLGMQPEVLAALRGRKDPEEAIHDLATRYAFAALMVEGQAFHELDPLSQMMIQHTLETIRKRASQVARRLGEDPLDEEPGLLLSLCKCLSRYLPSKPIGAHIQWKLEHYEGAVSRAMRQIENLVGRPEIADAFAAYVLETALPDEFKAQLLQMARGGGRGGLNYEAVVRFFALPATIEFVKGFAGSVQTARTLYDEQEYIGIAWRGRRRLPAKRRQGYLEAALASLERRQEASLDTNDFDLHDLLDPLSGLAWLGLPAS